MKYYERLQMKMQMQYKLTISCIWYQTYVYFEKISEFIIHKIDEGTVRPTPIQNINVSYNMR